MNDLLQRLGDARRELPAPARAVVTTVLLLVGWGVLDLSLIHI